MNFEIKQEDINAVFNEDVSFQLKVQIKALMRTCEEKDARIAELEGEKSNGIGDIAADFDESIIQRVEAK